MIKLPTQHLAVLVRPAVDLIGKLMKQMYYLPISEPQYVCSLQQKPQNKRSCLVALSKDPRGALMFLVSLTLKLLECKVWKLNYYYYHVKHSNNIGAIVCK